MPAALFVDTVYTAHTFLSNYDQTYCLNTELKQIYHVNFSCFNVCSVMYSFTPVEIWNGNDLSSCQLHSLVWICMFSFHSVF